MKIIDRETISGEELEILEKAYDSLLYIMKNNKFITDKSEEAFKRYKKHKELNPDFYDINKKSFIKNDKTQKI